MRKPSEDFRINPIDNQKPTEEEMAAQNSSIMRYGVPILMGTILLLGYFVSVQKAKDESFYQ